MSEPWPGGGAKGIRTPDLLIANETRYQLRHSPRLLNEHNDSTKQPRALHLGLARVQSMPPWMSAAAFVHCCRVVARQ
ncbi:protein of unknown function [Micropruina glycogenica]|uniref:Uncharacterized protein n=1 Tax=Micropruina glycogenica TaxID=75385 RepID=A0A2N9JLE3_9ACTN|nr:protein of unknown function [Micropruina glycogenica]